MKRNFILAIMRLKDDFINQKLLMTLYSIGSVLCILIFMYSFSNIPLLINQYIEILKSPGYRTYEITLEDNTIIDKSDFDFLKKYDDIESVNLFANVRDEQKPKESIVCGVSSPEYLKIEKYVDEKTANKFSSDNTLLLIDENDKSLTSEKVKLNDSEFTVGGTFDYKGNFMTDYYISFDAFIENGYKTYKIDVIVKNQKSISDNAKMMNDLSQNLENKYNIDNISNPLAEDGYLENQKSELFNKILIAVLIYIVCFIACAYLFKYVFDSNNYENTVYSIVGASKRHVLCIMLNEAVILSILSSIVAVAVHLLLYNSLFVKINAEGVAYNIWDYLIITVFTLVLSIITIIPFFIKYLINPIIKTKREL